MSYQGLGLHYIAGRSSRGSAGGAAGCGEVAGPCARGRADHRNGAAARDRLTRQTAHAPSRPISRIQAPLVTENAPMHTTRFQIIILVVQAERLEASMRTLKLHRTFPPAKKRSKNEHLDRLELRLAGKGSAGHVVGVAGTLARCLTRCQANARANGPKLAFRAFFAGWNPHPAFEPVNWPGSLSKLVPPRTSLRTTLHV